MVLGMTPLVALTGGEAAPGAALANLYAVPWVSLVVVPLVLLSLVTSFLIPPLAPLCWSGADAALSSLLGYLHWLDWSGVHPLPISLHQGLACLLALGCMMCAYHPRAILACLPLYAMGFAVLTERPPLGEVRVVPSMSGKAVPCWSTRIGIGCSMTPARVSLPVSISAQRWCCRPLPRPVHGRWTA